MERDLILLKNQIPTAEQISQWVACPLWEEFNDALADTFGVVPHLEYSSCSMQRGWNMKYRKKGKNLCTAYPQKGFFKVMVVISGHRLEEADRMIETFCDVVKKIYRDTKALNGSKWLMIEVSDESALTDILRLIALRA